MVWGLMVIPSFLLFVFISLVGALVAVLRRGLLGLWLGLELSFFGFIPILNGKTVYENEAASKYFVVQGVGSGLILVGILLTISSPLDYTFIRIIEMLIYLTLVLGFLVKLGVFPFHFWFPRVIGGSSWFRCFWLSVVQKVGPFWGLSGLGLGDIMMNLVLILLVITSLIGSLGGLAQTQFRPLLGYSSLGQSGWIGLICVLSVNLFLIYILIYSILLSGLLISLHVINSFNVNNIVGDVNSKGVFFWLFRGRFFISIRGVPPLAGSALKLIGVLLIVNVFPLYLSFLVLRSIISLYFYLRVFIRSVVCLGDLNVNFYRFVNHGSSVFIFIIVLALVNWVGGFPLFLICANIVL